MDRSLAAGFDSVADIYDRARPGYPEPLFDEILRFAAAGSASRVLEIGCGTGQATRSLAARGCRVTAVEPGPNTAARARENLAGYPGVEVITATLEDADLPAGAFDVVCAATAFHWVDPAVGVAKAHRLLRPGGVLALFSYEQVLGDVTPDFFVVSLPLYKRITGEADPPPTPARSAVKAASEAMVRESGLFGDVTTRRYDWDQVYDAERYALLVRTYSNTIALPEEKREELLRELQALIDGEFGGAITRPLVVTLVVGRKR